MAKNRAYRWQNERRALSTQEMRQQKHQADQANRRKQIAASAIDEPGVRGTAAERRQQRRAAPDAPATQRQVSFLAALRHQLNLPDVPAPTSRQASTEITRLKALAEARARRT